MAKNSKKTKQKPRAVSPFYALGATWLLYGLLFPLYRPTDYVIAFLLGATVFFTVFLFTLPVKEPEPVETPSAPTAKPMTDTEKKLAECELYLDAIQKISRQTKESGMEIAEETAKMEHSLAEVVKELKAHPEDLHKMHKFLNYYMPTTLKMLKTYLEVYDRDGENFDRITTETEGILHTMAIALDKQLDKLYADDAMDITAEATVLQQMLSREGLTEDPANETGSAASGLM